MSQENFSRPGAVDLSQLSAQASDGAGADGVGISGAYTVSVDQSNIQSLLESSMNAAVMLVFYSANQAPASVGLADDLQRLSNEFEGRYLLGRVDVDAHPELAQALQVPAVPYVLMVVQGRPQPLLQQVVPIDELRQALEGIFQQLTAGGFAGRHQPRSAEVDEETGDAVLDPRYLPAQQALEAGDVDAAIAEYEKLLAANAGDSEAVAGLARAQLLKRTQGVDLQQAREQAAAAPEDVAAQLQVADMDILGGHVDDAFARLIELIRRTSEDERDRVREHLLALFDAVGANDERVLRARRDLASALF